VGWTGRRRFDEPDRAQRTARLADDGWVLPWGLGRQVDHANGAFTPRLAGEGMVNRTGRRWTLVGPAGGPAAAVDPAGLVTPRLGGWSLDWWVGADDRWRLPSREATVRQTLVESTPVIETVLRVLGGEAVHRCFGVPGFLVVEVENRSPVPFALALAVRPYDPLGATAVRSVAVVGCEVLVDGRTALVLPDRPGRVAASTASLGDVAAVVLGGTAAEDAPLTVCADGLASVAALVPVAHRATVRVVVPLDGLQGMVAGLPSAAAAVRGWKAQCPGHAGPVVEVPDPVLQRALDTAGRSLLLVDSDEPGPAEEAAVLVAALARMGRHAEADHLVRTLWSRQRTDGSFDEPAGGGAPGGPHLWALAEHLRLRPDPGLAHALDRGLVAAERWLAALDGRGALSPSARRWSAAGRQAAGRAAGEAGLGVAAAALLAGAANAEAEAGDAREPVPPTALEAGEGASFTAAAALRLLCGPASALRPALPAAVEGPAGFDVVATVAAAASEVVEGRRAGLDRLAWLLAAGQPTSAWPDHVHPRTGAGSDGRGHSPLATAAFLLLVRDLLFVELAPGHVALLPLLPDAWRGQPLQVTDGVLSEGVRLSFAVRWHGERPALLWQASAPLHLTAPGLDPAFSTTEARGEALLGPASPTAAEGGATVEMS
jgi:hypothetical protein